VTATQVVSIACLACLGLLLEVVGCNGMLSKPHDDAGPASSSGSVSSSGAEASSGGVSSSGAEASPDGASLSGSAVSSGNGSSGSVSSSGSSLSSGSSSSSAGRPVSGGCPIGVPTTVSGVVYDPAGANPLYGVAVYIPSGSLTPLPVGASCTACASLYTGTPIASAVTDAAGHFVIPNAPSASNVPLVVQAGKWRKTYTIPSVVRCQDNIAPMKLTLPTKHDPSDPTVGDIPNIAVMTGGADSLECVLLRMGVDPGEYTGDPNGVGRIHIFPGYGGAGVAGSTSAVASQSLWDSATDLMKYDLVLLSCEGRETVDGPTQSPTTLTDTDRQHLLDYANGGGHVFASHFHYTWFNTGPFATPPLATWLTGSNQIDDGRSFPGDIVKTLANGSPFPEGVALQQWLGNVGALTNNQLPIYYTRHNVSTVNSPPGQPWIVLDPSTPVPNTPQYFSVDAPIGGGSGPTCAGRVVYSDLHATGGPGQNIPSVVPDYPGVAGGMLPSGCANRALTPQEKALEFMVFNLSSCLVAPGSAAQPPAVQ
jgi:hypothetical protein